MEPGETLATDARAQILANAMDELGKAIQGQGMGLSVKMGRTTEILTESLQAAAKELSGAMDRASTASERHAKALVHATWVLAGATGALVIAAVLPLFIHLA
jgi:hypothetical protein